MGMTIDEAISHLDTYSSTMGSGQTTQEQHEDAKRVAIDTMRKYEQLQADYENRLKAAMVATLEDLDLELQELDVHGVNCFNQDVIASDDVSKLIQQKINSIKAESEDKESAHEENN